MNTHALLLNWKRGENLKKVIESIRHQSIKVEIYLWNNNPDDTHKYDVDFQFNSPVNLKCWPRWNLASFIKQGYIFTLDDDIIFGDNKIVEDLIEYYNRIDTLESEVPIIGWTGVVVNDRNYWKCKHISEPRETDTKVDIVKGRFMFTKTQILDKVTITREDEDDIKISSYSNTKILPSLLRDRMVNLDEMDVGLINTPNHKDNRVVACKKYFQL